MKVLVTIFILSITTVFGQKDCEKCDIKKVLIVNENINQLNSQIVNDFLCTFEKSCKKNIEYSQFSNEALFKVIESSPNIYFKELDKFLLKQKNYLLNEIRNPIHDGINLKGVAERIRLSNASTETKKEYLKALNK